MHNLTATAVKQAKPKSKIYKMFDGGGLHVKVKPCSAKYWRYDYRYMGTRRTLALGVYPTVSLKEARKRHQEARNLLDQGIDPARQKQAKKQIACQTTANSFKAVATEWFATKMPDKSKGHRKRTLSVLKKDLFPTIGNRPVSDISAPELLSALRKIEARGAIEMAHRAKRIAGRVFGYAIVTARAERDPSKDLDGALKNPLRTHLAAITTPSEVGKLMIAIESYDGSQVVKAALEISPLLFQRPGEIRSMEWGDINWELNRWEIPAEKMKMREPHVVSLSKQALAILTNLYPYTGTGNYVFASPRGNSRCLSDNAIRMALRTLGYAKETMSAHGFRAMARTLLDEVLGFRVDWIEHQLAHAVKDPNGRAYNRTAHLEGRKAMMQAWADYLDKLREKAKLQQS
jgi:integrase